MARLSVSRVLFRQLAELAIYLGSLLPVSSSGSYDEALAGSFEV